jgi:hypothetical protein
MRGNLLPELFAVREREARAMQCANRSGVTARPCPCRAQITEGLQLAWTRLDAVGAPLVRGPYESNGLTGHLLPLPWKPCSARCSGLFGGRGPPRSSASRPAPRSEGARTHAAANSDAAPYAPSRGSSTTAPASVVQPSGMSQRTTPSSLFGEGAHCSLREDERRVDLAARVPSRMEGGDARPVPGRVLSPLRSGGSASDRFELRSVAA